LMMDRGIRRNWPAWPAGPLDASCRVVPVGGRPWFPPSRCA